MNHLIKPIRSSKKVIMSRLKVIGDGFLGVLNFFFPLLEHAEHSLVILVKKQRLPKPIIWRQGEEAPDV